jgi:hypothetical protein
MNQVPKSVEALRPLVDFTVEIHNEGSEDVQLITPGESWDSFRSQWGEIC